QAGLAHEIRFKHDFVMTFLFHAHIILTFSAFEEGQYNLLGQPRVQSKLNHGKLGIGGVGAAPNQKSCQASGICHRSRR
ncbi:MAG: hypothetical protein WBB55_04015, partial [Anaerolineales bacterium]